MLRYSNRSIFGIMEASPNFYLSNPYNATEEFNQVLTDLLDGLRSKAASGDSLRKYAAANTRGPSSQTIYGFVQCTHHLSEQECNDCLVGAISECCDSKVGGRVFRPSCIYRYETFLFSEPTADTHYHHLDKCLLLLHLPITIPQKGGGGDCIQVAANGGQNSNSNQTVSSSNDGLTMTEHQFAKLMEEDMGSAM
ncbi:hypothetical protein L6164_032144 [Bauhinia variegata]|uniref:Uncharacterized protein n=1 Tax=Bauhinia variegata TaxID=167791 RepID=A0ACB9KMU6_BAUVA|nr:hypothetical protein L6164_032144 [Bauhinia variegata]